MRGELIGKGTYGRVYLALNATTGEMIAVKQVEIPRTASDKEDSRQVTVVEALKSESETLKDLDHPNIVSYLGFEETPTFLSMCVELPSYLTAIRILMSRPSAFWNTYQVARLRAVSGNTVVLTRRSRSRSLARFSVVWNTFTPKVFCIGYVPS